MALQVRRVVTGHDADARAIVHLKAGDVMVQRGTIHNWINRGPAPFVLAVILVDAKSVEVGGKLLSAVG